ncbi:aminoglycoside adenylyltransferase family protein [Orrella sp. JC864]|uniref:aminoglycoside adenylyltransferase family protein n=1 Tax=Orrella sp. JC864 TaxID=3120298 RepID=UPI00300992CB
MTPSPPAEISHQLSAAQAVLHEQLGTSLLALHLFGSAVDAGLRPHSDIDLLATVQAPLSGSQRLGLMKSLLAVSAWPPTPALRPLEVTVVVKDEVVPWRYAPMRELQFGEWLREELSQGRVEPAMPDADLAILLTQARQHSVCLHGAPAAALFDPVPPAGLVRALAETVDLWNEEADWLGDERNIVLTLARIWYSLSTGRIASKDAAAAWVLRRLPPPHRPVLRAARAAYLGQAPDDLGDRLPQVAAFIGYAKAQVQQAYS